MVEKLVTVWSVKHALSRGIKKEEGCVVSGSGTSTNARRGSYGSDDYLWLILGRDAYYTEPEARRKALSMAKARLASLAREKTKIEEFIKEWSE